MRFLTQTRVLTVTGLSSLGGRLGSALVTVVGVATVVGVLTAMLALSQGASDLIGSTSPDGVTVLSRGAAYPPQSVLPRDVIHAVEHAPGVKRAPDGKPYVYASTLVGVDSIRTNGKRGTVYFAGFTPGDALVDADIRIIAGRKYLPGMRELDVSDPIRRMYRGFDVGDHVTLRGTVWTVVGVFKSPRSLEESVLRADADTVMSAFNVNTYQEVRAVLTSPAAYPVFKHALESDPALHVTVKTDRQIMSGVFQDLVRMLDFVAYFIGAVMASGAIFGALNSLYASVDARRRELATLRAIGFQGGPILASVLLEGMLLALPGALIGAAIAWLWFNGHEVSTNGFALRLDVTPHLVWVSVAWALAIGLIGASLPALCAMRAPVAMALRSS